MFRNELGPSKSKHANLRRVYVAILKGVNNPFGLN